MKQSEADGEDQGMSPVPDRMNRELSLGLRFFVSQPSSASFIRENEPVLAGLSHHPRQSFRSL